MALAFLKNAPILRCLSEHGRVQRRERLVEDPSHYVVLRRPQGFRPEEEETNIEGSVPDHSEPLIFQSASRGERQMHNSRPDRPQRQPPMHYPGSTPLAVPGLLLLLH